MTAEWIVLIETTGENASSMSIASLRELMELMAHRNPTALYSPDRYALQVVVQAPTAEQALRRALDGWREAQDQSRVDGWELVRAEVITSAEFQRDSLRQSQKTAPTGDEGHDLEEVLLRHAFHDEVTGLANPELFKDHLRHRLSCAARTGGQLALLLFELGPTRALNGWSGPDLRDELLTAAAGRLRSAARARDSLGRLSEDRFVVLLEDVTDDAAIAIGVRIVDVLLQPVRVGPHQIVVPVSFGVARSLGSDTADSFILDAEVQLDRFAGERQS